MKVSLCAFADEASADFGEQLCILKEEGIPFIELRGLDGKNVADLTEEEARRYRAQLDGNGIRVWSIGSPIGKISLSDDFGEHLKRAERVFRLAGIFGTERVRAFSFFTDSPLRDEAQVFEKLEKLLDLAKEYGIVYCHENEKGIYGDSAERCCKLLQTFPALTCVFDPANFVQCGQDVSAALGLLREKTDYYHIKDALSSDGAVVPAGEGDGRLGEVIAGIAKDTVFTVEPHLAVFSGYDNIDRSALRHRYAYPSARTAFSAAVGALKSLLQRNGYREENGVWIK